MMKFLARWKVIWILLIFFLVLFGAYYIITRNTRVEQEQIGSIIVTMNIRETAINDENSKYYKQITLQDVDGKYKVTIDEIFSEANEVELYLLKEGEQEKYLVLIDPWHCYFVFNIILEEIQKVDLACDSSIDVIKNHLGKELELAEEKTIGK